MAIKVTPFCEPEAHADSRAAKLHDGSLNRVEQIACYIAQHYLEPLTAEDIGHAAGVHPNNKGRIGAQHPNAPMVEQAAVE